MATSSIFAEIVIDSPEALDKLSAATESSKENESGCITELSVIWRDLNSNIKYFIGILTRVHDDLFVFKYVDKLPKSFKGLVAFPDLHKTYFSVGMFQTFGSRLPDRKRVDIDEILDRYGLTSYDQFELLRVTGGRQPIDTIEFVESA